MGHYFSDIKLWAKSLAVGCPMRDALPGCPINDMRELLLAKRFSAIDEMPVELLNSITQHHTNCLHLREKREWSKIGKDLFWVTGY